MIAVLALLLGVGAPPALPDGYLLATEIALTRPADGFDGTVQLLRDSKIDAGTMDSLWGVADSNDEGRNGLLRLVDEHGVVVETRDLERPLARLSRAPPQIAGALELTVDFSFGMGSYSGPATCFLKVTLGWLERMEVEQAGGELGPLYLARTLKQDWKWAGKRDVLSVSSHPGWSTQRPDGAAGGFVTEYVRYRWTGKRWRRFRRIENGVWENEEGAFPERSRFP